MKINVRKKRWVIAALAAICAFCVAAFVSTSFYKRAEATEWGDELIAPNVRSSWGYYDYNEGNLLQVSEYGAVINLVININDFSDNRYFDMTFSPSNAMLWLGANDSLGGEAQGSGRFVMRFMLNAGWKGIFANFYFPNGGDGVSYVEKLINSGIWTEGTGYSEQYNFCIRIIQVDGLWNLYVNDYDVNTAHDNAFSTYVGAAFKNASNQLNFTIANPQGGAEATYYTIKAGTFRGVTEGEAADINKGADYKYMSAYSGEAHSYEGNTGEYVKFSEHGGYVSLNIDKINRPAHAGYPQFMVAFSPNSYCTFYDDATEMAADRGRFYVRFMINENNWLYVAPHFENDKGDDWQMLSYSEGGTINVKFSFESVQGGWSFKVIGDNTMDYTSDFRAGVSQVNFMDNYKINFGVHGPMNVWGCNYAYAYLDDAGAYRGYDVLSSTSKENGYLMEVLTGAPAERVSYNADATSSKGAWLPVSAETAFYTNLRVHLTEALSETKWIQVSFGSDGTVMDANHDAYNSGNANQFMVLMYLNTDGKIYAELYFNNLTDDGWQKVLDMAWGDAGTFSNTAGSDVDISISFRQVNAVTEPNRYWGVYINDYLLDCTNFTYIVHRQNPGFIEGATKNIAITSPINQYGFVSLTANVYLTGVGVYNYDELNAVTEVSIADLTTTDGADLFADGMTVSGRDTGYLYNATSATETNDVSFAFKFTYDANNIITVMLRTAQLNSEGAIMMIYPNNAVYYGVYHNGALDYIRRSNPLVAGTEYTLAFSVISFADNSGKALVAVSIANSERVIVAQESVYTVGKTTDNGVLFGTGTDQAAGGNLTVSTVINRTQFLNNGTVVADQRTATGGAGASAPAASARAYYTPRWVINGGSAVYTEGQTINGSEKYNLAYVFGNQTDIAEQINTKQIKFNNQVQVRLNGTAAEPSISFINTISLDLIAVLENALESGDITAYEIGTLVKGKDVDDLTENTAGVAITPNRNGYFNEDSAVKYVSAYLQNIPSARYGTVMTSRLYVKITVGGTATYYYGSLTKGSLSEAASRACNEDAEHFTDAQRAVYATYIVNA